MTTVPLSKNTKNKQPLLIVDRKDGLGNLLAEKFSTEKTVILASPKQNVEKENIVHIPIKGDIPSIPDSSFSEIIFVDDGSSITNEILEEFLKKTEEAKATFIFITYKNEANKSLLEKILTFPQAKTVIIGDVFDPNIVLKKNAPSRLMEEIKDKGKVLVKGNGMLEVYPVLLVDVLDGIVKIVNEKINDRLFFLFPKNPITVLSLAHVFQKKNPLIKIDFVKEKSPIKKQKDFYREGNYFLGERISFEDRINDLDLSTKKTVNLEIIKSAHVFRKGFLFGLVLILFSVFLPLLTVIIFSGFGTSQLISSKNALFSGNFSKAHSDAGKALAFYNISKASAVIFTQEAAIVGQRQRAKDFEDQISTLYLFSKATLYLVDSGDKFATLLKTAPYSQNSFDDATNSLKNAIVLFQQIETENNLPDKISSELSDVSPIVDILSGSIGRLPQILGADSEKKYLILFQNNMELRPGGGFIGSYGVLKVKSAQIESFNIFDVYDADGQLKEHIEPPFAIRRYLPSANLYLRDSNYYLNFPDNALSAENFLNMEKSEKFDGVIAIDVTFAKDVLEAIGGVYVDDYKESVNSDNFFELATKHAEENFFPGSTQKKDFLASTFRSIINVFSTKKVSYLLLARAAGQSLAQKNILLFFNDSTTQHLALLSGYSSSIFDSRTQEKGTINDFTGISEANLGVNKVNESVERSVSKRVEIDSSGQIDSIVMVAYKNSSIEHDYKNYLRFIVPLGSQLSEVKINGAEQNSVDAVTDPGVYEKKEFKPPSGLEIAKETQNGKTVYGFLVTVPKDSIKTISIKYDLPTLDLSSTSVSYSFKFFKQPGTDDTPFALEVDYPTSLNLVDSSVGFLTKSGKSSFQDVIKKDFNLILQLAPR